MSFELQPCHTLLLCCQNADFSFNRKSVSSEWSNYLNVKETLIKTSLHYQQLNNSNSPLFRFTFLSCIKYSDGIKSEHEEWLSTETTSRIVSDNNSLVNIISNKICTPTFPPISQIYWIVDYNGSDQIDSNLFSVLILATSQNNIPIYIFEHSTNGETFNFKNTGSSLQAKKISLNCCLDPRVAWRGLLCLDSEVILSTNNCQNNSYKLDINKCISATFEWMSPFNKHPLNCRGLVMLEEVLLNEFPFHTLSKNGYIINFNGEFDINVVSFFNSLSQDIGLIFQSQTLSKNSTVYFLLFKISTTIYFYEFDKDKFDIHLHSLSYQLLYSTSVSDNTVKVSSFSPTDSNINILSGILPAISSFETTSLSIDIPTLSHHNDIQIRSIQELYVLPKHILEIWYTKVLTSFTSISPEHTKQSTYSTFCPPSSDYFLAQIESEFCLTPKGIQTSIYPEKAQLHTEQKSLSHTSTAPLIINQMNHNLNLQEVGKSMPLNKRFSPQTTSPQLKTKNTSISLKPKSNIASQSSVKKPSINTSTVDNSPILWSICCKTVLKSLSKSDPNMKNATTTLFENSKQILSLNYQWTTDEIPKEEMEKVVSNQFVTVNKKLMK